MELKHQTGAGPLLGDIETTPQPDCDERLWVEGTGNRARSGFPYTYHARPKRLRIGEFHRCSNAIE